MKNKCILVFAIFVAFSCISGLVLVGCAEDRKLLPM